MPPRLADLCQVDLLHDNFDIFGAMPFSKDQLLLWPYNTSTKYAICTIVHMELDDRFKSFTSWYPARWPDAARGANA